MNREELSEKIRKGERADFSGEDFSDSDLRGVNFSGSNCRFANFSGADFSDSDLRDVNFSDSDLRDANFSDSNLRLADFYDSDLRGANFSGANIAQCSGLIWAECSFAGHGERGRRLTAVRIDGEDVYFCGCFRGSAADLHRYIENGPEELKASRKEAFRGVWCTMTNPRWNENNKGE